MKTEIDKSHTSNIRKCCTKREPSSDVGNIPKKLHEYTEVREVLISLGCRGFASIGARTVVARSAALAALLGAVVKLYRSDGKTIGY